MSGKTLLLVLICIAGSGCTPQPVSSRTVFSAERPPVIPLAEADPQVLDDLKSENCRLRREVESLSLELLMLDTAKNREEWFIPVVLPQENETLMPVCDGVMFRVWERDGRRYSDVKTENGGFIVPQSLRSVRLSAHPQNLIQGYQLGHVDVEKGRPIVFNRYPFVF